MKGTCLYYSTLSRPVVLYITYMHVNPTGLWHGNPSCSMIIHTLQNVGNATMDYHTEVWESINKRQYGFPYAIYADTLCIDDIDQQPLFKGLLTAFRKVNPSESLLEMVVHTSNFKDNRPFRKKLKKNRDKFGKTLTSLTGLTFSLIFYFCTDAEDRCQHHTQG